MKTLYSLLTFVVFAEPSVHAQTAPSAGAQIRLECALCSRVTGRWVAVSSDSLLISTSSGMRALPTADIKKLQVRAVSRWESAKRRAMYGALIGAPAGLLLAQSEPTSGGPALTAVAGSISVGLAGALIGALIPSEGWKSASMPGFDRTPLPAPEQRQLLLTQLVAESLQPEDYVRLHMRDGRRIEGIFDGVSAGEVGLLGQQSRSAPSADITEIWQQVPATWKGAKIGMIVLAGVGSLVSAATSGLCETCSSSRANSALVGGAAGGVLGLAIGGIIGRGSSEWRRLR